MYVCLSAWSDSFSVHVCLCERVHVCMCTCIHACKWVSVCTCMHGSGCVCISVCVCVCACVYACVCTCEKKRVHALDLPIHWVIFLGKTQANANAMKTINATTDMLTVLLMLFWGICIRGYSIIASATRYHTCCQRQNVIYKQWAQHICFKDQHSCKLICTLLFPQNQGKIPVTIPWEG